PEPCYAAFVVYVDRHGERRRPQAFDLLHRAFGLLVVARRHDDGGARRAESSRHAEANAAVSASYDCDAAFEVEHHGLPLDVAITSENTLCTSCNTARALSDMRLARCGVALGPPVARRLQLTRATRPQRSPTEGTSMIADVRLFHQGPAVGSRPAPHVWCFVLAGAGSRRAPAALRRGLERATRVTAAERVVALVSQESAAQYREVLAGTPEIATLIQPAYRGSAAELFLPTLLVARGDPEAIILALHADETHDGPVAPCLVRAIQAVSVRPELTVLVGARPRTSRVPDGFVEPGA